MDWHWKQESSHKQEWFADGLVLQNLATGSVLNQPWRAICMRHPENSPVEKVLTWTWLVKPCHPTDIKCSLTAPQEVEFSSKELAMEDAETVLSKFGFLCLGANNLSKDNDGN